jgi:hypothetical protein
MAIQSYIQRYLNNYKRIGTSGILKRAWVRFEHFFFQNRHIVNYCDLTVVDIQEFETFTGFQMFMRTANHEITETEMTVLKNFLGKDFVETKFSTRFKKGAIFWTFTQNDQFAGYLWTIRGKSIRNLYFFPLTENDVQIFDAVVFPQFRGQKIYSKSIEYILRRLKIDGAIKVYGEMKAWNKAVLRAMVDTKWKHLGIAKKMRLFNKNVVIWYNMN